MTIKEIKENNKLAWATYIHRDFIMEETLTKKMQIIIPFGHFKIDLMDVGNLIEKLSDDDILVVKENEDKLTAIIGYYKNV